MAQTMDIGAGLTRGVLVEQKAGMIVLGLPGTDYQLHLAVGGEVRPGVGNQVVGRITARARRLDRVEVGGRFIEPVYGRPRTIQGAISAADAVGNRVVIACGCPFHCELTTGQKAADFQVGELVNCFLERGAGFEPIDP